MRKLKKPLIEAMLVYCFCAIAYADSDGTVALGDGFAVYTSFSEQGQALNVVPFLTDKPLEIASTLSLPISYSSIVTYKRAVFLRWWETLYVIQVGEDWKLQLKKTFDVPRPSRKEIAGASYDLALVDGNRIVLFNEGEDLEMELAGDVTSWTLRSLQQPPKNVVGSRGLNRHGDWTLQTDTCDSRDGFYFCLVNGISSYSTETGSVFFSDKFLVKHRSGYPAQSYLLVGSQIETIH